MSRAFARRDHQRGATLVEALVGVLLFALLVLGFLGALDASTRVSKVQGDISDMTENLRFSVASLVRVIRMAGCGGLPMVSPGTTSLVPVAIEVRDNSVGGADFTFGGRTALAGTDVLIVRGVIAAQVWDVVGADVSYGGGTGQITVRAHSPYSGDEQNLSVPADVVGKPVLLSLQSPLDVAPAIGGVRHYSEYRIGVVTAAAAAAGPSLVLSFTGTGGNEILDLNRTGTFLPFASNLVSAAGLLDNLIFFVAKNDSGVPALYRASSAAGRADELISPISNLQVALGCDINRDGVLADSEWFNSEVNGLSPSGDQLASLREVRLTVVAQAKNPDSRWSEPPPQPENAPASGWRTPHRQRSLTVRVVLRSHPPLEDA